MRTDSRCGEIERALRVAALIAIPAALALVPMRRLERAPAVCILRRMGIPCWGCGMTRALASALRGKLRRAWRYNPRVAVVGPLLAFAWAREVRRALAPAPPRV